MIKKGAGILCQQCLNCVYYDEYQTSNGAIPRCELDEICLSLSPKGGFSDESCPSFCEFGTSPQKKTDK